jgi:hypothetical protein
VVDDPRENLDRHKQKESLTTSRYGPSPLSQHITVSYTRSACPSASVRLHLIGN